MRRQKKYITGDFLEAEIIHIPERCKKFKRARKVKESCPAQKNLNNKKAQRYFTRKVHLNFLEEDLYIDLTFEKDFIPKTRKEVKREIKKYIDRLNYRRKKMGLEKLKYMYVISNMDNEGNKVRLHCHMIVSGGMDRNLVESLWPYGYANTERLQFNEWGVTGKSLYMARQAGDAEDDIRAGEKSWGCSLNLKNPEPMVSDKAITKAMAERILRNPEDREFFEKLYPGWTFTDCIVEIDDYNGTNFLVRMRRYDRQKRSEQIKNNRGEIWLKEQKGTQLTMDVVPTRKVGHL